MVKNQDVNIEQLIHDHSLSMAEKMLKIADWAKSEEDIRYECNKLIDSFLLDANISVKGRHEYGLAGGRIDSKYGGIIIEYKQPKGSAKIGTMDSPGSQALIKQLKQRFTDFRVQEKIEPERLFGVGTDGKMIIFVRQRGKELEADNPQPITSFTIARLIRAIVSLGAKGRSFNPENLSQDFGADCSQAKDEIKLIHDVLVKTKAVRAATFFQQWKILYGEVCGYDVEGKNPKVQKLGEHYGIVDARPAEILFSVHTYYAIFMKLLSAEIISSVSPLGASTIRKLLGTNTPSQLRRELATLEQGGIWRSAGITNFLEGDLFSWYLDAWDDRIAEVFNGMLRRLENYDPTTLSVDPFESRDLLKKLYQHLFPKSVRHDLGEYYTPDWLAELVIKEVGYDGNPDKRVLDPACGSGTFLVMILNKIKLWYAEHRYDCGYDEAILLEKILKNVVGFDLNPLAVMAARTNFLLAIRELLIYAKGVDLPVFLCDSVMTPLQYGSLFTSVADSGTLKTAAGIFQIPSEISDNRESLARYAEIIEVCVKNDYSAKEFLQRCTDEELPTLNKQVHQTLYEQLKTLNSENKNGIWARIIKNAFAPLFIGKVDYVIGNPPWVNWENLPNEYRDSMKPLWAKYNLFSLSGSKGRLGGGKKDLSMLFVYSCIDKYLDFDGKLGFVITQSVFKSQGAGDGFRGFHFTTSKRVIIKPIMVHDLSEIQVFEGATNRTAIFICSKVKEDFSFPIPYFMWKGSGRISQESTIEKIEEEVPRLIMQAIPLRPKKKSSPWLTAPSEALSGLKKVLGASKYTAYEGVNTGGLNGCYWIEIIKRLPNRNLLIQNLHNVGKIKVEQIQSSMEPDLVYPLLRGKDLKRWFGQPSGYIILAQDPLQGKGIPEPTMKTEYPNTFTYFKQFEGNKEKPLRGTLRGRALYKKYFKPTDPFYSMYNVGSYSLAPIRVLWRQFLPELRMSVQTIHKDKYLEEKVALTQHVVTFVSFQTLREAHYFTACGNSSPVVLLHWCSSTAKSYGQPYILESIKIPTFDSNDDTHLSLSRLSKKCHTVASLGNIDGVKEIEQEIDQLVAKLWSINSKELRAIQNALADLKNGHLIDDSEDDSEE